MAFSTQRAVSDGTLQLLMIEIEFFDKSEITAYFDNIPTTAFIWATDKSLRFNAPVPQGIEVLLRRTTDLSAPRHIFSQGAQFKDSTLDEDFKQILHIAQEAVEGANVGDIYQPLNMHGNPILNVGPAVDDGSAVSLGQVKTESASAWVAANQASAALAGVQASAATATAQAGIATSKAAAAAASEVVATEQAGIATTAVASIGNSVATAQAAASTATTQAGISTAKAGESSASAADALVSKNAAANSAAIADTAGLQLGMSTWGFRAQPFKGFGLDDGQELDKSLYPDFVAALTSGLFPTVTEAVWQSDPTKRGCFVLTSSTGKFRMRDLNGVSSGSLGASFLRGGNSATPTVRRDQFQGHRMGMPDGYTMSDNVGFATAITTNPDVKGLYGRKVGDLYGIITDGVNGTPRTGSETFPTHATGAWMTRLFGIITPLGSAEASSLATAYASLASRTSALEGKVKAGLIQRVVTPLFVTGVDGTPTGNAGEVLTIREQIKTGDLLMLESNDASRARSASVFINRYVSNDNWVFQSGGVITQLRFRDSRIMYVQGYTSGYGIAGLYRLDDVIV